MQLKDTIVALATAPGIGAIAMIRLSGEGAWVLTASVFQSGNKDKDLLQQSSHTLHFGKVVDGDRIIDEVVVSLFKGPHSYTGEDVVEISCHGSPYIQQHIIQLFIKKGCRMADPGEFTLRAFFNGKLDLGQAEAVADLIVSNNETTHRIAMQQMRGGFSNEIRKLRDELLNFTSLIELELDFAEEDVEFADREQFRISLENIASVLKHLSDSFAVGNVLKKGIPVAIVGAPNVGKSTLLNALLMEERAIVSEIAGTTRDAIEDEMVIEGMGFRFIDTAGIRTTEDVVENIGIQRTFEKISQARLVLYLADAYHLQYPENLEDLKQELTTIGERFPKKEVLLVVNKMDLLTIEDLDRSAVILNSWRGVEVQHISAKHRKGIESLEEKLLAMAHLGHLGSDEVVVTNARHYDALVKALGQVHNVQQGLGEGVSGDLLAIDIRQASYHLGEIIGEITTDDLLGNIFANFCIGK